MTTALDRFHQTLQDGVENEITVHADELARSIVATLSAAVDDERGRLAEQVRDAERMRDFHRRSAEHIAAKRNLAELVIEEWQAGAIPAETALLMIRSALAVGEVKTREVLGEIHDA